MTKGDIDEFLEANKHITAGWDNDAGYFRNEYLPWYREDKDRATRIVWDALESMADGSELMSEINKGLEVEQITRITGYFTKVSGWNKGKKAELKDRYRSNI